MREDPLGSAFGPIEDLVGRLIEGFGPMPMPGLRRTGSGSTRTLDTFGRDLTAAARAGELDPVIGRDEEIDRVVEVLSRRTKNNPVLVGEPGVGKTAIVEGMARRVVSGDVPAVLRDVRVIALDLAAMVAGTKYRGEFEQRLTSVIAEVVAAGRSVVVFIDELHVVVGAGAADGGAMDAGAILKPALARGELQLVGATTPQDYRRHIERDPALERRFEPVAVPEPTVAQTVMILRGLRERYETHHQVRISDAAIDAAASLSDRYVPDRFLPDKAVDLIDLAAARARLRAPAADRQRQIDELTRARDVAVDAEDYERAELLTAELGASRLRKDPEDRPTITADDVAQAVSRRTGIPVAEVTTADATRLLALEQHLQRRVIGQHEAVEAVADAVRSGRAGLSAPDRPVGSFLFLGPTGVGKTELARALADALFGSDERLIRFDMSEFADRASATRLIGAPPGYVGHEDAGQLTEAVRRHPYSVLLLDEIEKAHVDITATLLQVLDSGRLTDARGRTADFRHAIVIMTSNLGAEQILAAAAAGRPAETVREPLLALARLHFRPEFLNRVDDVVLFEALGREPLRRITALLLDGTRARLDAQGVALEADDAAIDWLADRGHQPEYGARPLRRTIGREVERRLSRMLLAGEVGRGQRVRLVVADGELVLQV